MERLNRHERRIHYPVDRQNGASMNQQTNGENEDDGSIYKVISHEDYSKYVDLVQDPLLKQILRYYGSCFLVLCNENGKHRIQCVNESFLTRQPELRDAFVNWQNILAEASTLGVYWDIHYSFNTNIDHIFKYHSFSEQQKERIRYLNKVSLLRSRYLVTLGSGNIQAFCGIMAKALSTAASNTNKALNLGVLLRKKRKFKSFRRSCVARLQAGSDLNPRETGFWAADHHLLDHDTEHTISERVRDHTYRIVLRDEVNVIDATDTLAGMTNGSERDAAIVNGIRHHTLRRLYARTGGFKKSQAGKERRLARRQKEKERESVSGF